jgi:hypothetical protein
MHYPTCYQTLPGPNHSTYSDDGEAGCLLSKAELFTPVYEIFYPRRELFIPGYEIFYPSREISFLAFKV